MYLNIYTFVLLCIHLKTAIYNNCLIVHTSGCEILANSWYDQQFVKHLIMECNSSAIYSSSINIRCHRDQLEPTTKSRTIRKLYVVFSHFLHSKSYNNCHQTLLWVVYSICAQLCVHVVENVICLYCNNFLPLYTKWLTKTSLTQTQKAISRVKQYFYMPRFCSDSCII